MNDTPHRRIVAALRAGELETAAQLCADRLAGHPQDPVALHLNGVIAWRRGDAAAGAALIEQALALRPAMPDATANLGQVLIALDRLDEAEAALGRALALSPGLEPAVRALAAIRPDLERKTAAIRAHQAGDHAAAGEAYRALLARRPRWPEVLNNLGVLCLQRGEVQQAARLLRQAVDAQPRGADTWANLGAALKRSGRIEAAVRAYRRALEIAPGSAGALYNLGHALVELQRLDEAVAAYQRALDSDPRHAGARLAIIHQRRHLCDWRDFDADAQALRGLIESGCPELTPFHALVAFDDPALQAACAARLAQQAAVGAVPLAPRPPRRDARIRIGYLSSDFRRHPVAWLISEVIERHDRARFEVTGYSHGVDDRSPERARLVAGFEHFVDIRGAGLDEAAARIRADGIDILVDLNGHTLGARTGILARRPAPVQVAWLGYPGAMGAGYVDHVLADAFVVPAAEQRWYAERLVHLPDCFQPSDTRKAIASRTPTRGECGLPEAGFVFCCFNNAYKLTPAFFDVWMRLLLAVPGSVLWLVEMSAAVRANLAREAAARGVDPARLVFARRAPLGEYLARYRIADLFLDTLPYNAGTTANDALWAGLPLLTCAGNSFAARMAGSLLHAAGLPELVTHTLEDYEARAIGLARDPQRLAALRARVAAARTGAALFDCPRFVRNLEAAFERMNERWLAGAPAEPFGA